MLVRFSAKLNGCFQEPSSENTETMRPITKELHHNMIQLGGIQPHIQHAAQWNDADMGMFKVNFRQKKKHGNSMISSYQLLSDIITSNYTTEMLTPYSQPRVLGWV